MDNMKSIENTSEIRTNGSTSPTKTPESLLKGKKQLLRRNLESAVEEINVVEKIPEIDKSNNNPVVAADDTEQVSIKIEPKTMPTTAAVATVNAQINPIINEKKNELNELLEMQSPKQIIKNKILNEKNNKNNYEDVENNMEKLFAGIEDDLISTPRAQSQTNIPVSNDEEFPTDLSMNKLKLSPKETTAIPIIPSDLLQSDTVENVPTVAEKRPHSDLNCTIVNDDNTNNTNTNNISSSNNITNNTTTNNSNINNSNNSAKIPPKKKRKTVKRNPNQKTIKKKNFQSNVNLKSNDIKNSSIKPPKSNNEINALNDLIYKGPYVQVKPDGSIVVVNGPTVEEDNEKQGKKTLTNNLKIKHTNSSTNKIRGLHCSTLSTKYDAHTTDASWLCVFCKKGPHKEALGDLFGPYIISTTCNEFELFINPELDEDFCKKRKKSDMVKCTNSNNTYVQEACHSKEINKKRKKSIENKKSNQILDLTMENSNSSLDALEGMIKISETTFEIWIHEDCAIWADGIYLIGAKIVGLESAVWNSLRHICTHCLKTGATLQCLNRGCIEKSHFICAKLKNWCLNESTFNIYCENHTKLIE